MKAPWINKLLRKKYSWWKVAYLVIPVLLVTVMMRLMTPPHQEKGRSLVPGWKSQSSTVQVEQLPFVLAHVQDPSQVSQQQRMMSLQWLLLSRNNPGYTIKFGQDADLNPLDWWQQHSSSSFFPLHHSLLRVIDVEACVNSTWTDYSYRWQDSVYNKKKLCFNLWLCLSMNINCLS